MIQISRTIISKLLLVTGLLLSSLTNVVATPGTDSLVGSNVTSNNPSIQAGNVVEAQPRQGERRFNANAFKVSHNAFEKPEEYYTQLDDYNVWGLELDVHWEGGQFEVYHDLVCLGRNMNEHVNAMTQSITWREKVTVLWLQINDFGICPLPHPNIYEPHIKQVIDQNFGWSCVYTPNDFKNIDKGKWPSWQELVRRGKNLIIVTERTPHPTNNWFFEVIYNIPTAPAVQGGVIWNKNQVFFNSGEYRNFPLSPEQKGDYWASRMYPDRWCAPFGNGLAHETQGEWEDHIRTEATQVATNCLDTDWTNGRTSVSRKVHPPQPTFVVDTPTGSRQLGTLHYPYQGSGRGSYDSNVGYQDGLLGAISRVADYGSSTEIWITPGDYITYRWEFIESPGITINKPMILKKNPDSSNGIVVIR